MMRPLVASLLLLLTLLNVSTRAQEVAARNGAKAEVTGGEIVIRFTEKKEKHPPAAAVAAQKESITGKKIALTFEAKSSVPLSARAIITDFAPPYTHLALAQTVQFGTDWQTYQLVFTVKPSAAEKVSAPLLVFDSNPASGEVRLKNIQTGPAPAKTSSTIPAVKTAPATWKAIDTGDLYVKPGSALDFSPFFDRAPAGAYGRVIVNKNGDLAFASAPDTPVRFFSVQLMPPQSFRLWSNEEISEYADAVARQGYNLVRFHFWDNLIAGNWNAAEVKESKLGRYTLPEKPEELTFNTLALDRFRYLLAELKKRGIYWNFDFMTSFVGYSNGKVRTASKQGGYNTKVQMYVNPNFRANWKAAATRLLNEVNPYTKMTLRDDPALALTSCLNEQEILFESRNYGHELDGPWHAFLQKKYGTYEKMREAWGGKCGTTALPETGTWDAVPPIAAPTVATDTPAGRDMAQCCGEMEYEMSQWYLKTLQELKFPGLVSNFNMRSRLCTVPARALYPVITMNAYHAHPQFGPDQKVNTFVKQDSALASGGASLKKQIASRFLDRPFANTEFGIVFWNPYRHEQGLLYGAGAALQGWSALTCHAAQVVSFATPLLWFHAGDDPVIRASEVVEALAFRRGDVAASTHTIEIPVTDDFIFSGGRGMKVIDDELTNLWVLCRVGLIYGPKKINYPVTLTVPPGKTSNTSGTLWFSEVDSSSTTGRISAVVAKLKEMKILPADNVSSPKNGILESDTGEVTLETRTGGELFVRTPRLEGAVIKDDKKVALGATTIEQCTVPASVTLASIDGKKTLADARRLLLVFSTDARNTGMKFTNEKEERELELGTLPILIRTGDLKLSLTRSAAPKKVTAYALKLNGERADEIPVKVDGKTLSLAIALDKVPKAGPTPFYELVIE